MRYFWLNILILAGPVILSFDQKVSYYKRWPAVFLSILVVGLFYVGWDIYAARRGDWGFNSKYLMGKSVFGLPLEEVLFFLTVPFSCIFIYECVRAYLPETIVFFPPAAAVFFAVLFGISAYIFRGRNYTCLVFSVSGIFFLLAGWFGGGMLSSSHFWIAIFISYLPFIVTNGILTGLPVVIYNSRAILGIRITSIPLEDFFYSFSMLGFYFLVFLLFRPWVSF